MMPRSTKIRVVTVIGASKAILSPPPIEHFPLFPGLAIDFSRVAPHRSILMDTIKSLIMALTRIMYGMYPYVAYNVCTL